MEYKEALESRAEVEDFLLWDGGYFLFISIQKGWEISPFLKTEENCEISSVFLVWMVGNKGGFFARLFEAGSRKIASCQYSHLSL